MGGGILIQLYHGYDGREIEIKYSIYFDPQQPYFGIIQAVRGAHIFP